MVQGSISNQSSVDMSRLQLLRAEGDCLGSISNHLTHSDILWLCWNHCPYTSLPSWIPVWNLRVLQVAGDELKMLWMDESEAPMELRELYISADVLRFPKSIGQLGNLEKIEAKTDIIEPLPEEFCRLRSLKHLSLRTSLNLERRHSHLKMLPESFGNLRNLQHLDLSGCSHLKMLPNSFGNLRNLSYLDLSGCFRRKMLPDSLGNLSNLSYLDLSGCSRLKMLPDSFGNLKKLSHLNLSRCSCLETSPDLFENLRNLQHLDLSGCSRLKMLPDSFRNLKKLSHLNLSGCSCLETSPDLFENLSNLQHLDLSRCGHVGRPPDSFENHRKLQHLALPKSFGNPLTVTSTKKMVFKVAMVDKKSKRRAMKSLAAVKGVESVSADMKEKKITVLGDADPVFVGLNLRKFGSVELLSVGPAEEEKQKAVDKRYNEGKGKAVDQRYKTGLLS